MAAREPVEDTHDGASPGAQVAAAGAWGMGGRAVLLIGNCVAAPFTIRLLGPSAYGLWALLLTILGWGYYADAGMATASTKIGADCVAHGDDQAEVAVVWTALGLTSVITTAVVVVLALGAPFLLSHLMHVHTSLLSSAVVALRVTCAVLLVQAIAGVLNTPPLIRLQLRRYTMVTTTANLVTVAGVPIALAIFSGGVLTASTVLLASAFVTVLGVIRLAIAFQPAVRHPRFNKQVMRQLLSYGGATTIGGLATIPLTSAERFFLASNHSTSTVAYFAVAVTLATTIQVIPEQMLVPLVPGMATLAASGRLAELKSVYRQALAGMFLVLTPVAILLALVAHPFLSLWAGPLYGLHSTGPFLVAIIGVWFNAFAWVPISYLQSSGRPKLFAYLEMAEIPFYLAGAWFFTERFGAMGAAIVWSARFGLDAIMLSFIVWRIGGLPAIPLSNRRFRSLFAPAVLGGASALAATVSHGLVLRISCAGALGAAYTVVAWQLVLSRGERDALIRMLVAIVRPGPRPRHARRAV
jgi:O-antigen/teichoic acid export membrane protein